MAIKNKDYRKKLSRLLRILNRLEIDGKILTRELSADCNVSVRTVQRDIELLNMAEFPLVQVNPGEYEFFGGFSLKKLPLSNEEASLLAFMGDVARSMGDNFDQPFKCLATKVLSDKAGESPFAMIAPKLKKPSDKQPFMEELQSAMERHRKVKLVYNTEKGVREYILCPLKLLFYEGYWYILVQVDGKPWTPKYRLDKIASVKILPSLFTPPPDLIRKLSQKTSIWFTHEQPLKAKLRVDKYAAQFFKDRDMLPGQRITAENKDGSITVEAELSRVMEALPVVLQWIPYVHVLAPEELKAEVKKRIDEYGATL